MKVPGLTVCCDVTFNIHGRWEKSFLNQKQHIKGVWDKGFLNETQEYEFYGELSELFELLEITDCKINKRIFSGCKTNSERIFAS